MGRTRASSFSVSFCFFFSMCDFGLGRLWNFQCGLYGLYLGCGLSAGAYISRVGGIMVFHQTSWFPHLKYTTVYHSTIMDKNIQWYKDNFCQVDFNTTDQFKNSTSFRVIIGSKTGFSATKAASSRLNWES